MKKNLFLIVLLFSTFLSATAFAATLNLYEKPDASSKTVATIKTGDQLVPFFYTDKKDWVKVANPQSGDVGWVKASEIKGPTIITKVNGAKVQQQIVTGEEKQPMVYKVIQYSGPNGLKQEDAEKIIKTAEKYHDKMKNSMQKMQENMQKSMQQMFKDFGDIFYTFPIIQPIIVVPEIQNGNTTKK